MYITFRFFSTILLTLSSVIAQFVTKLFSLSYLLFNPPHKILLCSQSTEQATLTTLAPFIVEFVQSTQNNIKLKHYF